MDVRPNSDGLSQMHLCWTESGGPEVSPPSTTGFRSSMIKFAASYELGGEVELDYSPSGLVATLTYPQG